jgi:hypothetical protein
MYASMCRTWVDVVGGWSMAASTPSSPAICSNPSTSGWPYS